MRGFKIAQAKLGQQIDTPYIPHISERISP
jgi:hypothetical protein